MDLPLFLPRIPLFSFLPALQVQKRTSWSQARQRLWGGAGQLTFPYLPHLLGAIGGRKDAPGCCGHWLSQEMEGRWVGPGPGFLPGKVETLGLPDFLLPAPPHAFSLDPELWIPVLSLLVSLVLFNFFIHGMGPGGPALPAKGCPPVVEVPCCPTGADAPRKARFSASSTMLLFGC